TVNEVVGKYSIDAVHFDDYFYPYSGFSDQDLHTYRRFGGKMNIDDWRRRNVTGVIVAVRQALDRHRKATGRRVRFGVSPFGIWANRSAMRTGSLTGGLQSYFKQHADTRLWVKCGYIDYIVPQLYWEFSHETAAYAALADWWSATVRGTGVKLFIGHAVSRLGSSRKWRAPELANQLRYNNKKPEISGSVCFSYRHVFTPANSDQRTGVNYVLKNFWRSRAALPR
ncbi:MAG: family 10 glycosylhydrolase, partial [Lentisphaeria bacterium]|nr:family 10 glycosylhydrolase [Lentisphaeria bacterium]